VREHFSEEELVNLTMAIVAINGWNRLAIGFRAVPANYQPAAPRRLSLSLHIYQTGRREECLARRCGAPCVPRRDSLDPGRRRAIACEILGKPAFLSFARSGCWDRGAGGKPARMAAHQVCRMAFKLIICTIVGRGFIDFFLHCRPFPALLLSGRSEEGR